MHFSSTVVAVASLAVGAHAQWNFDLDDAPRECREICRPIDQLQSTCEVDLSGDNNDMVEELLEAQCFCTNESFEVARVAALCQACVRQVVENGPSDDNNNDDGGGGGDTKAIEGSECREDSQCESGTCVDAICQAGNAKDKRQGGSAIDGSDCVSNDQCRSGFCAPMDGRVNDVCQNPNGGGEDEEDEEEEDDDDDDGGASDIEDWRDAQKEMDKLLSCCGFETTSYSPNATSFVQDIAVSAAEPTNADQLTTTFAIGPTPTSGGGDDSSDDGSGDGDGNNGGDSEDNNEGSDDEGSDGESNDNENGDSEGSDEGSDGESDEGDGDGSAASALSPFYFAGALVAGAMAFI